MRYIVNYPLAIYIWRAAFEFKEIWKVFYISLLNLTPWNFKEISLLTFLIILLERKKTHLIFKLVNKKLYIFYVQKIICTYN